LRQAVPVAGRCGFAESAAWAEVERLGLNKLINEARSNGKVSFGYIASYYLENRKFKAKSTQYLHTHNVEDCG